MTPAENGRLVEAWSHLLSIWYLQGESTDVLGELMEVSPSLAP